MSDQQEKTMTDFEQLAVFNLGKGDHESAEQGMCAMEAVAWLEGLEHTDAPECTCPVIAAYVRRFNDSLPNDQRQRLVPYLPRLVGTVSPDDEKARAEYLAFQAIRVFAPMALDAVGLKEHAQKMRNAKTFEEGIVAGRASSSSAASAASAAASASASSASSAAAYAASAAASASASSASSSAASAAYASAAASAAAAAAYASAAASAAAAAGQPIFEAGFRCLDGLLLIGKQSVPFSRDTHEAVTAYRELIAA